LRLQKTGEGMKVLAGSAVNKKVCWLIAEKGIVLRTTDGGKHWLTVSAPDAANFTAIKAVSATEATIADASGKMSYSTVDGGATWSVVARP
ncbi:MAG TPA: oxidoreductase, partial [Candidatus Angelobacter sp.]|nr:oxidoreductase [Candidatus Angelobacter sp.]